ncbi:MAG TPA: hypothetical protein VNH44_17935 [Micropepsaceae bacterium]|nr:hypothetical protein [Micropepsaceae bacterium]
MGQPVLVAERLRLDANPFVPGAKRERVGRPLQTALGEVIRQAALETPIVVVAGSAGTGKSLLADMAERAFSDMGLTVRQIHRGDLMVSGSERYDVLLVDEADSITDLILQTLQPGGNRPATTTILLCLPSSVRRLGSAADSVVVELTRLTQSDTRAYLLQRAANWGVRELLAPDAVDLLVDASRGLPRTLWSIASLAYFSAAYDGSSQIGRQHVAGALASQMTIHKIEHGTAPAGLADNPAVEQALNGAEPEPAPEHPPQTLASATMAGEAGWARKPQIALGRLAGMGVAFAAAAILAVAIPAFLISGKPSATATVNAPPVVVETVPRPRVAAPVEQTPAAVEPPKTAKAADVIDAKKDVASKANPKPVTDKALPAPKSAAQTTAKDTTVRTQTETVAKAATKETPKPAPVQAQAGANIASPAPLSPEAAAQAAAAAEAAAKLVAAQQDADRAKAAQQTAEQVRAEVARIMAEQQQAEQEKQEAEKAKAAREAAEEAQAALLRARLAKDAADRANAAMQASQASAQDAARAEAARQSAERAKRSFANSLFGVHE